MSEEEKTNGLALVDQLKEMLDLMDKPKAIEHRGAYVASMKLGLAGLAQLFGRELVLEDEETCVTNCDTNAVKP